MKKIQATVGQLALEANVDIEVALMILWDKKIQVNEGTDMLCGKELLNSREALGLCRHPLKRPNLLISSLSVTSGLPEQEVRRMLRVGGVINKTHMKRVPKHFLKKAEILLGIRTETTHILADAEVKRLKQKPRIKHLSDKGKDRWPTIGPQQDQIYLLPKDVEFIHFALVKDFRPTKDPIDPPGVRSEALLESAVHRTRTALGSQDKYPTVAMAGASLLYAIVMDHPFHNGNKRTAIVSLLVYLDKNGWVFTAEEDEIYVYLLNLASHQLRNGEDQIISNSDNEVLHLAKWLQNKIRKVNLREFPIQFRQLRSILLTYGCRFEFPTAGNRINIFRDKLHTQIGYHNEGTDVERGNIHKLRKDLALDEDSGYDSDIFYNATPRIPDFINKYRKLLDRLAKV